MYRFTERAPAALKILHANLDRLGLNVGFRIHPGSVSAFLRRVATKPERHEVLQEQYEVLFLDPPWDAAEEYAATLGFLGSSSAMLLAEGALVIAEHRRKQRLENRYGVLERTRLLEQGDAALSFYAASPALTETPPAPATEPRLGAWPAKDRGYAAPSTRT